MNLKADNNLHINKFNIKLGFAKLIVCMLAMISTLFFANVYAAQIRLTINGVVTHPANGSTTIVCPNTSVEIRVQGKEFNIIKNGNWDGWDGCDSDMNYGYGGYGGLYGIAVAGNDVYQLRVTDTLDSNNGYYEYSIYVKGTGVHNWVLTNDTANHWQVCTVCHATINWGAHSYAWQYDGANHWQQCTICGYTANVAAHNWSWQGDAANHWQYCATCGASQGGAAHNWIWTNDAANHWRYCSVCGRTDSVGAHIPKTSWEINENQHWIICSNINCNRVTTAHENHFDDNIDGYCDRCNYFMYAIIPLPTGVTYTYSGLEQGLTAGIGYSFSGISRATNAGTYQATAVLSDTGRTRWSDGSNTNKTINWSIGKRPLHVLAKNLTLSVGSVIPSTFAYRYSNAVSSEVPSFTGSLSTTATNTNSAGTFDITQGSLALVDNGAFLANNYNLTYTAGVLKINAINTSLPISTKVLLDTTPPIIGDFTMGERTPAGNVTLTATGLDDGALGSGIEKINWILVLDGSTVASEEVLYTEVHSTESFTVSVPEVLTYASRIEVYDAVGNVSTKEIGNVYITHPLEVTAKNQTVYKGQDISRTLNDILITNGALLEGDRISSVVLDVDTTTNKISINRITIVDSTNAEVDYYEVTLLDGTLTLLDRQLDVYGMLEITDTQDKIYSGLPYTPGVKVTWTHEIINELDGTGNITHTTVLVEGTDYRLEYTNNINAGTATIKAIAIEGGMYSGELTTTFNILQRDLTVVPKYLELMVGDTIPNLTYGYFDAFGGAEYNSIVETPAFEGEMYTPAPNPAVVGDYDILFKNPAIDSINPFGSLTSEEQDILAKRLRLADNTAGNFLQSNYNLVFKSYQEYSGTLDNPLVVKPISLNDSRVEIIGGQTYTYDGTPKQPSVTVKFDGNVVDREYGYDVRYQNNTNAGTATIVITGKNNFKDEKTLTFEILPRDLHVRIDNKTRAYGDANPLLTYTIQAGDLVDGEVPSGENINLLTDATIDSNIGQYNIYAEAGSYFDDNGAFLRSNYNEPIFTNGTLTITNNVITEIGLLEDTFVYTGGEIYPPEIVKAILSNGERILNKDIDYEVQYNNNINVTRPSYVSTVNITPTTGSNYSIQSGLNGTLQFYITPATMEGRAGVSGGVESGGIITASANINTPADNTGVTYTYQWYRTSNSSFAPLEQTNTYNKETLTYTSQPVAGSFDGMELIPGATSSTYAITEDDFGYYIAVVVKASKANYYDKYLNAITAESIGEDEAPSIVVEGKHPGGTTYQSDTWTNDDVIITATATDNFSLSRIQISTNGIDGDYSDLTLVRDEEVGGKVRKGHAQVVQSSETDSSIYYFKAIDTEGNQSVPVGITVKLDKTPPAVVSNTKNTNDWTNQNVTVTTVARDGLSGINGYYYATGESNTYVDVPATLDLTMSKTYAENANNQYFGVKDQAGNTTYINFTVTNIDKVNPQVDITLNTSLSSESKFVFDITATDDLSGVKEIKVNGELKATNTTDQVNSLITRVEVTEPKVVEATASDYAGNIGSNNYSIYGINYLGNGIAGSMPSQLKNAGQTVYVQGNTGFVSEELEFIGWNDKADGTGTTYGIGEAFSEDRILNLYAQWKEVEYILDRVVLSGYTFNYTGLAITPQEKVYNTRGELLQRDVDYTVTYTDNIMVGEANVHITGVGKYVNQVLGTSFLIIGTPIEDAKVELDPKVYVYDGLEKKPKVTVTYGTEVLRNGIDYLVTYRDNINAGTAYAIITGRGKYYNQKEEPFTILKAARNPIVYSVELIVGEEEVLDYTYDGETVATSIVVANNSIATVDVQPLETDNAYTLRGVSVGKTSLIYDVPESTNYESAVATAQITVVEDADHTTPLYGQILINNNDEYTNSPRTLLTIRCSKADYMYLSTEDVRPSVDDENWIDYSLKVPYEFSSDEGTKVIYAWFKDSKGTMSNECFDDIILQYNYDDIAHDKIMLDQTEIDTYRPDVEYTKYQNEGINVVSTFKQQDTLVNKVRSGVDYSTIEYGMKNVNDAEYTWQEDNKFNNLSYGEAYAFVTRAKDKAGNGITVSAENVITMPLKQGTVITLKDKKVQNDGRTHEIDPAEFDLISGKDITGKVTYTYYLDRECNHPVDAERYGATSDGGAPSKPGTYYVVCTLRDDPNYFDTDSNVARLRIGWFIQENDNEVFAYVEETSYESDEYVLNVTGSGDMKDLADIKKQNTVEDLTYWIDFQDKIIELNINAEEGDSITNIGAEVFSNLTKITEINIPQTIESIGNGAFNGDALVNTKVNIPASVEEIGVNPFVDTKVTEFGMSPGNRYYEVIDGVIVTKNHKELVAYPGGKLDEEYKIPEEVVMILPSAIQGADNLKTVKVHKEVTSIEEKALYDCENLKQIEIFDMFNKSDNTLTLKTIGDNAFGKLKSGASIYTFDKKVADAIKKDVSYDSSTTKVYWPPVITLHPTDQFGANGMSSTFYIEAEDGYVEGINYQWFVFRENTGRIEKIDGATESRYTTPSSLTAASSDQDKYFCGVWNMEYYRSFFDKVVNENKDDEHKYSECKIFSDKATLTLLDNAYYRIERSKDNTTYLFETLKGAFDKVKYDTDVIRVIKDVPNEKDATLATGKTTTLILDKKINLSGIIKVSSGASLAINGAETITKASGAHMIDNQGKLKLDGTFTIENAAGGAIVTKEQSTLEFVKGTVKATSVAISADSATVNMTTSDAVIEMNSTTGAIGVQMEGYTKFNMSAGSINVTSTSTNNVVGIMNNAKDDIATGKGRLVVTGGTIKAIGATSACGVGIQNTSSADTVITNATIEGSRFGIENTDTNRYGNVELRSGTVKGAVYGVMNNANGCKVTLGVADGTATRVAPIVIGEQLAIFNTIKANTFEFYDGELRSNGTNIVYENVDNTDLILNPAITDLIYTENGRNKIVKEEGYVIELETPASGYKLAYLVKGKLPKLGPINDITVQVGETAPIEPVIEEDGHPPVYEYQWEISVDGGNTWQPVTVGTGMTTKKYTIPPATMAMDGYLYRLKVTNDSGSVYTNVARLYVLEDLAYRDQRPIVRIFYSDGKNIKYNEADSRKYVDLQIVVKSFEPIDNIKFSYGSIVEKEILSGFVSPEVSSNYRLEKASDVFPIVVDRGNNVREYTYTYYVKAYANGSITVKATDTARNEGIATQTIDVLYDLRINHTISELTSTNPNLTITFFANKPVIPINPQVDGVEITMQKVDQSVYSYKWLWRPSTAISSPATFYFEDEFGNIAQDTIPAIYRVIYKDIKFNDTVNGNDIKDLTVIDAYNIASELELQTEVNDDLNIQSKYGINKVEADMFMARARDVGAADILSNATSSKSYDGLKPNDISASQTEESGYGYANSKGNNYISTVGISDEVLSKKSSTQVDVISKDPSLYKGQDISGFNSNSADEPYMYRNTSGKVNNTSSGDILDSSFRAVIVGN